jgi:hypothetical protein
MLDRPLGEQYRLPTFSDDFPTILKDLDLGIDGGGGANGLGEVEPRAEGVFADESLVVGEVFGLEGGEVALVLLGDVQPALPEVVLEFVKASGMVKQLVPLKPNHLRDQHLDPLQLSLPRHTALIGLDQSPCVIRVR